MQKTGLGRLGHCVAIECGMRECWRTRAYGQGLEGFAGGGEEFGVENLEEDVIRPTAYLSDCRRIIRNKDIKPADHAPQRWNLAQKNVRIRRWMSKTRLHRCMHARSILPTPLTQSTTVIIFFWHPLATSLLRHPLHLPVVHPHFSLR